MKLGGRIAAAIEILTEIENRGRPAKLTLQEWGRANRYAGSKDRSAIGNLVFDALRQKLSIASRMDDNSPRSLVIGTYIFTWGEDLSALMQAFKDDRFAPSPPTKAELMRIREASDLTLPNEALANLPEWILPKFEEVFGEETIAECKAFAQRAPIDIRVNRLKATLPKIQKALSKYKPAETTIAPDAMRIAAPSGSAKSPALEAELAHARGWFEIQDEASQIASLMTAAGSGDQVLDYCAGAGGKTLALASEMQNKGQIHAYDSDKHRLKPIVDRLKRAGVRNTQIHNAGDEASLATLDRAMDIVLVDSPCSGSGTWRRHPDSKWRITEHQLNDRCTEQRKVLKKASEFVKLGGRLIYVTCSVLKEENQDQIERFLKENSAFERTPLLDPLKEKPYEALKALVEENQSELLLTPAKHGTDGFFIAAMIRK